jgi:hypothetical protein
MLVLQIEIERPGLGGPLIAVTFIEMQINLWQLLLHFVLGPLVYFPSELIQNNGAYKQLVGLLERVKRPSARPLPNHENSTIEYTHTDSIPLVRLEPAIPVSEMTKAFHASTRTAICSVSGGTKMYGVCVHPKYGLIHCAQKGNKKYYNEDDKALLGNDSVKQQWKRSDRCYAMNQYTCVNNGG